MSCFVEHTYILTSNMIACFQTYKLMVLKGGTTFGERIWEGCGRSTWRGRSEVTSEEIWTLLAYFQLSRPEHVSLLSFYASKNEHFRQ